ncbi:MAG: twin-arginine translocase TatA/TatE family subunit [Acidimicrobiales bacterium]
MLSTIFSGGDDLIVILVAVVVLFGGKQLPKLAKNTGEALREFRKAKTEAEAGETPAVAAAPTAVPVAPVAAPVLPAAPVSTAAPVAVPGTGDSVTLKRSELEALLAERAAGAQAEGPKAES